MKKLFLLTVALIFARNAIALTCQPGQYPDGANCKQCATSTPVGTEPYYCPDGINRIRCPDHEYETHKDFYENLTGYEVLKGYVAFVEYNHNGSNGTDIAGCRNRLYFKTPHAELFIEGPYSEGVGYYTQKATYGYSKADTGYYLTDFVSSGWYGNLYSGVSECPPPPDNAHNVAHTDGDYTTCPWECDAGYFRDGNVCRVCPADLGYSVNAAGECVTSCSPGYYVATAGTACAKITTSGYYSDALHTVKYGETSGDNFKRCPRDANGNYGMTSSTYRLSDSVNICFGGSVSTRYTAADRGDCVATSNSTDCYFETHGVLRATCFYTTGTDGNAIYDQRTTDPVTGATRRGCAANQAILACDAGWYDPYNGQNHTVIAPYRHPCQPVGTGYYSPDGDLKRYPCPEKTATCGYGECAKSIADCKPYKTIMTSTGASLMMQPDQRTHPALGLRMPDDGSVWYGQADAGARSGHINIEYSEKPYALINPLDLFIEVSYEDRTFLVPEKPTLPY